eukprot:11303421-Alexandrium_andersonii.AAC.1
MRSGTGRRTALSRARGRASRTSMRPRPSPRPSRPPSTSDEWVFALGLLERAPDRAQNFERSE